MTCVPVPATTAWDTSTAPAILPPSIRCQVIPDSVCDDERTADTRPHTEGHPMLEPTDVARYERELRAMLMRAGNEDPEGFATIARLINQTQRALPLAAVLMRANHGYSWAQIAAPLHITRQSAQERYSANPAGLMADIVSDRFANGGVPNKRIAARLRAAVDGDVTT